MAVLQWADHPSKDSRRLSVRFRISELVLNENREFNPSRRKKKKKKKYCCREVLPYEVSEMIAAGFIESIISVKEKQKQKRKA
jgi:hypothetical protein